MLGRLGWFEMQNTSPSHFQQSLKPVELLCFWWRSEQHLGASFSWDGAHNKHCKKRAWACNKTPRKSINGLCGIVSTTDCNWQWVRSLKDDEDLSYNIIGLGYFGTSCTAWSFFPPPLRRCCELRKCMRTSRVLWNCCWYLSTWGRWHQFRIMSCLREQCPSFLQSLKQYRSRSIFQSCNANGLKWC